MNLKVIGNRLAQVHFYKKDDTRQSNAETMETLVHKTSIPERNFNANTTSTHIQYSSMSNTNAPSPTPQVILSQPAPISTAAKPVRDSAQFVSEKKRKAKLSLSCFQVDLVSAVLFPVAFIVFNIIYW
jgi:hypothetical protein